jgi:gliding motility-associated-like protein
MNYTQPERLITLFTNTASDLNTSINMLKDRHVRKMLLVAGCLLLVFNSSFGQSNGDYRTIGNVTFAASLNWERYNVSVWVAAGTAPAQSDNVITIRTGNTAILTANKTLDQVVVASGGVLIINSGQTLTIANSAGTDLSVSGTINNSGTITPTGTIVFNASSAYNHTQDGGTIPDATWNASSDCNITGVTANEPGGLSQSFGNFTWNCIGQTGTDLNINPLEVGNGGAVTGDFSLISTGTGSIRLSNNANRVLDISGNFNISGGIFHLAIAGGSATVNIGGDFNMTGGILTETGTSSVIFVFDNGGTTQNFRRTAGTISNNLGFTVNSNVTIDFGTNDFANGGGTFTLSNGATLQTANTTGINGSIQTTSRSLSASANYTFDGTAAQVTGSYLPATVNNFKINNVNGITLTNSVTAAGTLFMNSGNINTGANTFILSNPVSSALNYTTGIIIGRFERFINTTSVNYFFPVGTTLQIQSLTANFVNLTTGSLLVQYIAGDPGNSGLPITDGDGSQITNQFTSGYWSALAKNSLASTNYNIDLNAAGFGPYAINGGTRLIKRTDTGGSWLINGTHSDAIGSVVKRIGMSGIYNIGGGTQFGIGRSGPRILTQPSNQTVCENAGTSFSVTATGHPVSSYQWYKAPGISLIEGGRFTGTNLPTVNISNLIPGDAGNYYLIVTDGYGNTVQSTSALLTINLLPTPTFTVQPGATACSTTNVTYTTQTGQLSYVWTFTGVSGTDYSITSGGTGIDNTVTLKWLTAGSKIVTINYINAGGCTVATATSSTATMVTLLPTPTFTTQPGATACSATNVTYTTQALQSSYIWTFPGVLGTDYSITSGGTGTDNTVTLKWLTAGSKTVSINYTNTGGCTAATATSSTATMVTLLPTPTFIAQPGATACSATNVTYTTQALQSGYVWTFTGVLGTDYSITSGGTGTDNTVTLKWLTAGSKIVTINYTNAGGCTAATATSSTATMVTLLPTPTLAGPNPVCTGVAGNVYTTEAGMNNYLWAISAGGTITAGGGIGDNLLTVTWTTSGAKTVKVNYNNVNGCTATSPTSYNVTVNALPLQTLTGQTPACVNVAGTVYTTEAGMSNYLWAVSEGGTITAGGGAGNNTVTVTWTTPGAKTVKVTYTDVNGCTATSATTYNVTVNSLPGPTLSGPNPVCTGLVGNVYTTEVGMSNYLWAVSAGGIITAGGGAGNNTVTVTWTTFGVKAIAVNYTNVNGCTASNPTTYNVTVNPLPEATASNNGPVCVGSALNLTGGADGMTTYSWIGPNGFISILQSPSVSASATVAMAGVYTLTVTNANGCIKTATTIAVINALPLVNITSSNSPMCLNDLRTLTGSPAGGTFIVSDGPGTITGNVLSATGIGTTNIEYNYTNICTNKSAQSIIVNEKPVAIAGPDQELTFIFETQMTAELSGSETGEWSLISGSGHISDIHSPSTRITELSIGGNKFLWKVLNGSCDDTSEVKITVYDLFVPSVITPNGDGKNDNFKIGGLSGKVELIIINRWGNEEYSNGNYLNDWDGRNNKGAELPNDTYFYILKFENGRIKKGSVLIKR